MANTGRILKFDNIVFLGMNARKGKEGKVYNIAQFKDQSEKDVFEVFIGDLELVEVVSAIPEFAKVVVGFSTSIYNKAYGLRLQSVEIAK